MKSRVEEDFQIVKDEWISICFIHQFLEDALDLTRPPFARQFQHPSAEFEIHVYQRTTGFPSQLLQQLRFPRSVATDEEHQSMVRRRGRRSRGGKLPCRVLS